jgi:hypothetical protein
LQKRHLSTTVAATFTKGGPCRELRDREYSYVLLRKRILCRCCNRGRRADDIKGAASSSTTGQSRAAHLVEFAQRFNAHIKNEAPKKARGDRGRNGASIAKFRTRRQSHICEMPRYRAVLSDIRLLTRRDRTRWLGRQDSNLCIRDRGRARDRIRRARGRGRQVDRGRAGTDHRGGAAGAQRDRAMTPIFAIDTRGARFG